MRVRLAAPLMAEIFYPVGDGTYDRLLRLIGRHSARCECRQWAKWIWLDQPYCTDCLPFTPSESQLSFWGEGLSPR